MKIKLREYIEQFGPAPPGDVLYVIHDATTGWSKYGISGRWANDRLTAIRSRYLDLTNAEIVGVLVTPLAREIEACLHLSLRGRQVVGERFKGVRPAAVLRYARQLDRDLRAVIL